MLSSNHIAGAAVGPLPGVPGGAQPSEGGGGGGAPPVELGAGEIRQLDGEAPEGQAKLQLRWPQQKPVRRQPAVGRRDRGVAAGGGGDMGGGEEVLQLRRRLLRAGPPVWRVHAGGVEEDGGGRLRAGGVPQGPIYFDDLFL